MLSRSWLEEKYATRGGKEEHRNPRAQLLQNRRSDGKRLVSSVKQQSGARLALVCGGGKIVVFLASVSYMANILRSLPQPEIHCP